MKLYTEEQVLKFINDNFDEGCSSINLLTPIELPSDEEIMQIALEETQGDINMQIAFNNGAVYICKLIEGQFNTKEK